MEPQSYMVKVGVASDSKLIEWFHNPRDTSSPRYVSCVYNTGPVIYNLSIIDGHVVKLRLNCTNSIYLYLFIHDCDTHQTLPVSVQ